MTGGGGREARHKPPRALEFAPGVEQFCRGPSVRPLVDLPPPLPANGSLSAIPPPKHYSSSSMAGGRGPLRPPGRMRPPASWTSPTPQLWGAEGDGVHKKHERRVQKKCSPETSNKCRLGLIGRETKSNRWKWGRKYIDNHLVPGCFAEARGTSWRMRLLKRKQGPNGGPPQPPHSIPQHSTLNNIQHSSFTPPPTIGCKQCSPYSSPCGEIRTCCSAIRGGLPSCT